MLDCFLRKKHKPVFQCLRLGNVPRVYTNLISVDEPCRRLGVRYLIKSQHAKISCEYTECVHLNDVCDMVRHNFSLFLAITVVPNCVGWDMRCT